MEFIEKTALRVQELVEKEITHFGMIQRPDGSMLTVKTHKVATTAVETCGRREGRAG